MKRNQRQRRCDACHKVKAWFEYSSSDHVCIECKREIYGQGLQALITTTNNVEVKHD